VFNEFPRDDQENKFQVEECLLTIKKGLNFSVIWSWYLFRLDVH